jgi:NAD(P)-dependent dehydrogenase (short-subunit alcohol dehydrogenase family)
LASLLKPRNIAGRRHVRLLARRIFGGALHLAGLAAGFVIRDTAASSTSPPMRAIGTALPGTTFYAATKAEVLILTRRFAMEVGRRGVTVNLRGREWTLGISRGLR